MFQLDMLINAFVQWQLLLSIDFQEYILPWKQVTPAASLGPQFCLRLKYSHNKQKRVRWSPLSVWTIQQAQLVPVAGNVVESKSLTLFNQAIPATHIIVYDWHSSPLLGANPRNSNAEVKHPKNSSFNQNVILNLSWTCRQPLHLLHPSCRHKSVHIGMAKALENRI